MRGIVSFGLVVLLSSAAWASPPLKIRNGSTVRVSLKGKRESGVGLRPNKGAWRVELGGSKETADQLIDVVDVTDGAHDTKWQLTPTDGVLTLDAERFVAGHAYRVTVMRGLEPISSALIYLYPPVMTGKSKVSFEDDETAGNSSDEIAIVKKPSL